MTSKEALSKLDRNIYFMLGEQKDLLEYVHIIEKDLEVLEIIKKNPDIIWYCGCYTNAYEMIIFRPGFMIEYSVNEIVEQFNKVKEWLNNNK